MDKYLAASASGPVLAPKGAGLGGGLSAVARLRGFLQTMREALKKGQWPKPGESVWW